MIWSCCFVLSSLSYSVCSFKTRSISIRCSKPLSIKISSDETDIFAALSSVLKAGCSTSSRLDSLSATTVSEFSRFLFLRVDRVEARRSKFWFNAFDRFTGRTITVSSMLTYSKPEKSSYLFSSLRPLILISSSLFSSGELLEDRVAGPIGKSWTLKVPSIV